MKNELKVGEIYKYSWDVFKANVPFLIKLGLVLLVVYALVGIAQAMIENDANLVAQVIGQVAIYAIELVLSMGVIVIFLKLAAKVVPSLSDLYQHYELVLKYFIASFVLGMVVLVGIVLLIVPGVIWGIMFGQTLNLVVDEKLGPFEAFSRSSKLTRGYKMQLFIFGLVALGVNMLGMMALGVGLFVTVPLTRIVNARIYWRLKELESGAENQVLPASKKTHTPAKYLKTNPTPRQDARSSQRE